MKLKFIFPALVLLFSWSCASVKTLPHEVGNTAYDFSLPDQNGDTVKLSEVLARYRGAVIAFYPKDDSMR